MRDPKAQCSQECSTESWLKEIYIFQELIDKHQTKPKTKYTSIKMKNPKDQKITLTGYRNNTYSLAKCFRKLPKYWITNLES